MPGITSVVNSSLAEGEFTSSLKHALVRPLLKKKNLPLVLKNYRPVSNLSFISKIIEKCVALQVTEYTMKNGLCEKMQSAYRTGHSTETAILKVKSDLLHHISNQQVTALILLDLSAAFDTVDHGILLERLATRFHITDTVLKWFKEYLTSRTQSVIIDGSESTCVHLCQGVPQGSVLGPLCFTYYTMPIGDICRRHNINYHLYADDTQLYLTFDGGNNISYTEALDRLNLCISDIKTWMCKNKLKLNSDKTEAIFIGTWQQLKKCEDFTKLPQKIGNETIQPVTSVRDLGFMLDNVLKGEEHVKKICAECTGTLKTIMKIRNNINTETCKLLVNGLVTSRLDYCNSSLSGVPDFLLDRLQSVQNMACRTVLQLRKYDHISKPLMSLHWLKIKERINFKIALLAHKCIHQDAPQYLKDLLPKNVINKRALRSAESFKLDVSSCKSAHCRDGAFQHTAPSIWNSLPPTIRCIRTIVSFKKHLKTYFFTKSHPYQA